MSSLMPSEKYSCSGSPLMLTKGSTAIRRPVGRRQGRARLVGFVRRRIGGGQGDGAVRPHLHVADETESLAGDGADQLLVVAAVAERLAGGVDAAGQGGIRHDPAAPDRGDEVVLAHHAVAVLHQVDQEVEHLGLDRNGFEAAAQLPPVGIKPMISKEKLHAIAPLNRRRLKGYSSPSQGQIKRAAKSSSHVVGILRAALIAPDAL